MRIAVVGSRTFPDLGLVRSFVSSPDEVPPGSWIVSGGARGVDEAAMKAADQRRDLAGTLDILPDYEGEGRKAPLIRNQLIVDNCDRLVAFWDGKSRGTAHVIGLARAAGKPVTVYGPGSAEK